MEHKLDFKPYRAPAGGWGSMKSLAVHLKREGMLLRGPGVLKHQNKPNGYSCVSCAWAKPAKPHAAEFCENGAKATVWELTDKRAPPEFFARHTLEELRGWSDFALEDEGRLTEPMRYDPKSDRYVRTSWQEAFAAIGTELRALDPKRVVFYASGRASLETSYMYALMARMYGNNNLPDSSNMCHESTSVALPESIGVSVGTVLLEDFETTDGIFFFGQNVGSNSPRMLHQLQGVSERGKPIVTFNPLKERGLERFVNPQQPTQLFTSAETRISCEYHQVRAGGDIAAIAGMCKAVLASDARALAEGRPRVLDTEFIEQHTHGFEAFVAWLDGQGWQEIEHASGLPRSALESAADIYAGAQKVIAVYGMGLTQHKLGVDNIQMLVNLLLLRGNIGRRGAGICPIRGHSNVQGQRTVGIAEKPELVPLDRLAELYDFSPPREEGLNTVEACKQILSGDVHAFVGLGGNFLRAVPERGLMEAAWPRMKLTVQVATKLNRSHLFNGEVAYLLPCLGRIEIDEQSSGPQVVTIEDSTTCVHASRGVAQPASEHLLSEQKIVAELAKAILPHNPKVDWEAWSGDYSLVREAIEATYPDDFHDFNERMWQPGGFPRNVPARDRIWKTDTGMANFKLPGALHASFDDDRDASVFRLMTLRSNDQFNTTVYGYVDRFRGVHGTRMIVFMNPLDMAAHGFTEGDSVGMSSAADDGVERRMAGFRVLPYDIPHGCLGAYYPECNALIPLWQYAQKSQVPAAKSVPVRIFMAPN